MRKSQLNDLHKLSREEKIELVQILWDDISAEQFKTGISEEHKRKLEQTLNNISEGKTTFKGWEEAKAKYITRK